MSINRKIGTKLYATPVEEGPSIPITVQDIDLDSRIAHFLSEVPGREPSLLHAAVGDYFSPLPDLSFYLASITLWEGAPQATLVFDSHAPYYYDRGEEYRGNTQKA